MPIEKGRSEHTERHFTGAARVTNIAVVIGSTRDGRFGDRPAKWIHGHLNRYCSCLLIKSLDLPIFADSAAEHRVEIRERTEADRQTAAILLSACVWNEGTGCAIARWYIPEPLIPAM
jgi:hypothetical protein